MRVVTTFAVVWIEITDEVAGSDGSLVTTFAVVWIEIFVQSHSFSTAFVTTFAVVWIEIILCTVSASFCPCHHLRGGVD